MLVRLLAIAATLVAVVAVREPAPARAQAPSPAVVRVALLPQWTVQQHRGASGVLREALDGGVVDRTVFSWQHGLIQRQALVWKPVRVLPEPEAGGLGGRGRFEVAVRPPSGPAAWTEITVTRPAPTAADVLLLEIGGERNTIRQVLESLLVTDPARGLVELPLVRPAFLAGTGVPVVTAPFEQPLPATLAGRFHEAGGIGLLVVRSPLRDVRDGDLTPSGPADTVPFGGGDWREGDRVLLRVPAAALERGVPGVVLAWKDRTLQTDPDAEFPRRSALPLPLVR
jgi:hypothetical protein